MAKAKDEKILADIQAVDAKIKQKKTTFTKLENEIKSLENKRMELESSYIKYLLEEKGLTFGDLAKTLREEVKSENKN